MTRTFSGASHSRRRSISASSRLTRHCSESTTSPAMRSLAYATVTGLSPGRNGCRISASAAADALPLHPILRTRAS